jgi:hypothetical protein
MYEDNIYELFKKELHLINFISKGYSEISELTEPIIIKSY